jgi:hypothetical protein
MIKRDDGDGRDGISDSGPGVSDIDTIVTVVTESLDGMQRCPFQKAFPAGALSADSGAKPQPP